MLDNTTYLRDSWNILDFVIVIFSLVELIFSGSNLSIIKVLRLLRTLRPLRFITHNVSMKIVVNSLLSSVKGIMNVGVVVIIVWLMFAILGVSLFSGKFYSCSNEFLTTR